MPHGGARRDSVWGICNRGLDRSGTDRPKLIHHLEGGNKMLGRRRIHNLTSPDGFQGRITADDEPIAGRRHHRRFHP